MSVVGVVVKNTIAQGLSKFVSILSSILLTVVLTRILGKADFGVYTFLTSLVLLFGTLSDWGTNIVTVREASKNPGASKNVFANAVVARLLLTALAFVILNLVVRVNPNWAGFKDAATVASLVLLVLSLKTSTAMVFHAFQKLEWSSLVDLVASLIFLLLVLVVVSTSVSVSAIMFVWFLATLVAALLGVFVSRGLFDFKEIFNTTIVNAKSVLAFFKLKFVRDALPAGFLFVVSTVYNRVDILILQYFKGNEAVATYGLPYKVYDQIILVAAFLMASMFPLLARSFIENKYGRELKEYYQRSFDTLLVSGVLITLVFVVLSPFIVSFLGGGEYRESIGVLRLLSFAILPSFINHLTGYSLLAFGKQKLLLAIAVGALTLNIVLNLVFVPRYSFYGSAVITLLTEVFVLLVSTVAIVKTIKYTPSFLSFPSTLLQINRIYSTKKK